jgi:hypothetical protein
VCCFVGQDCILRRVCNPPSAPFSNRHHSGKAQTVLAVLRRRGRRIDNPPQVKNLPHEHQTCRYTGEAMRPKAVLSLDWWSVIAALGAAAIVKLGFLPHVPW